VLSSPLNLFSLLQKKKKKKKKEGKEKNPSLVVGICSLSASALRLYQMSCDFYWVINTMDLTVPGGRNAIGNQILYEDRAT